jgi:flagellar biosynthetic protein FlhB
MSESSGEKNFAPTDKRKRDAAQKGDVLRSRDLGTAAGVMIGAVMLKFSGPWLLEAMSASLRAGFIWDRGAIDSFSPGPLMLAALLAVLPPVLLVGIVVMAASLISQIAIGEGRWVAANLAPKASRLDPLKGLARMFGPQGWIELGKGLLKLALLGAVAWIWARGHVLALLALGMGEVRPQAAAAWEALTSLLFVLAAALVVIALVDFPIQFLRRMMRLKMSFQEMRDESKEAEGAPEKKMAIRQRQRQRQIAMGGMAGAMRDAQFVVTNPTHFAVAMTYDPARAAAPIVLAKGRGEKALAIRELAAEYGVPVLEYPALARSVYYTTRERQVIREELYAAVAGVLAFVLSLKRGDAVTPPPIEVPVALRFDADGRLDPAAK